MKFSDTRDQAQQFLDFAVKKCERFHYFRSVLQLLWVVTALSTIPLCAGWSVEPPFPFDLLFRVTILTTSVVFFFYLRSMRGFRVAGENLLNILDGAATTEVDGLPVTGKIEIRAVIWRYLSLSESWVVRFCVVPLEAGMGIRAKDGVIAKGHRLLERLR